MNVLGLHVLEPHKQGFLQFFVRGGLEVLFPRCNSKQRGMDDGILSIQDRGKRAGVQPQDCSVYFVGLRRNDTGCVVFFFCRGAKLVIAFW